MSGRALRVSQTGCCLLRSFVPCRTGVRSRKKHGKRTVGTSHLDTGGARTPGQHAAPSPLHSSRAGIRPISVKGNRPAELTSMITHQIAREGDVGPANAHASLTVQLLHDVHGRMIRRNLAAEHRLLGWNNNMLTVIIGKSYNQTVIHHAKNGHDAGHLPHCRLVLRKDNAHRLPDQRSIKFAPLNLSLAHEYSLALGSPRNTVSHRQLLATSPASPDGRTPPSSSARRPIWGNAAGSSPDHPAASGGSRRRRDISP